MTSRAKGRPNCWVRVGRGGWGASMKWGGGAACQKRDKNYFLFCLPPFGLEISRLLARDAIYGSHPSCTALSRDRSYRAVHVGLSLSLYFSHEILLSVNEWKVATPDSGRRSADTRVEPVTYAQKINKQNRRKVSDQ